MSEPVQRNARVHLSQDPVLADPCMTGGVHQNIGSEDFLVITIKKQSRMMCSVEEGGHGTQLILPEIQSLQNHQRWDRGMLCGINTVGSTLLQSGEGEGTEP